MRTIHELFWFVVTSMALALLALALGILVSGCAPQQRQHVSSSQAMPMPEPVAVAPPLGRVQAQSVVWQPIPNPQLVASPIDGPTEATRKPSRPVQVMNAGGKIIVFEPGKKYPLYCPEFGAITIQMPEGEVVEGFNAGNSGEWMVEKRTTRFDLPTGRISIRRAPYAPPAELHVYTDAGVTYQFLLYPQQKRVSKEQQSLVVMVNTDTEARRREQEVARAEAVERRRREQAERAQIPFDYVRAYQQGMEGAD